MKTIAFFNNKGRRRRGERVLTELASSLQRRYSLNSKDVSPVMAQMHPEAFDVFFRILQFCDTYRHSEKVAPLVRQLPWSSNLHFLGKCKAVTNGSH